MLLFLLLLLLLLLLFGLVFRLTNVFPFFSFSALTRLGIPANASVYMSFDSILSNVIDNQGTASITGTLSDLSISSNCLIGNCLLYLSENSVLLLGSSGISINSTSGWTLSAWVSDLKPTSQYRTLFRGAGPNGNHPVISLVNTDLLGTWENSVLQFFSSGYHLNALIAGSWHHIVAVGLGGETKYYINGSYVGSAAFQSTTNVYGVGNYQVDGGQTFADLIDELRIWTTALSEEDILRLYNATLCNASLLAASVSTTTTATTTTTTTAATSSVNTTAPSYCAGKINIMQ